MIFESNFEELIIDRHKENGADKLLILSAYINVRPIEMLVANDIYTDIILGTFNSHNNPINPSVPVAHDEYVRITKNSKVSVWYANSYNHSKIYRWSSNGETSQILAGSANFTNPTINKDYRETLFNVNESDFEETNKILTRVLKDSTLCTDINYEKSSSFNESDKDRKPLVHNNNYEIINFSPLHIKISMVNLEKNDLYFGYNWGHGPSGKSNTSKSDSYIHFHPNLLRELPNFFPNSGKNPNHGQGKNSSDHKKKECNAEFFFDDDIRLDMSFEGTYERGNIKGFYNKIASFPQKKILGEYIRKRLGIGIEDKIEIRDLINYGRDNFEIKKDPLGENQYLVNFSNSKKDFITLNPTDQL